MKINYLKKKDFIIVVKGYYIKELVYLKKCRD